MQFQRAARTDKSVSAIKQIVSLKIYDTIINKINDVNKHLPDDIRLMGCTRVINSFDAKNFCDARTYSYLMPTFALCPISEVTQESYRVTKEVLELFNSTLQGYQGTHIFHNFTSGKKYKDDSAVRYIKSISCSEPFFPCKQNELEFVVVRLKGQSFMMHQIRKMIGLAIAVVKGFATEEHIKKSMEEPFMDIPKAPGLGLMLEEVHFDRYNRKYGGDGQHQPIEWNKENDSIEKFKEQQIFPIVIETEMKERSMLKWLLTLHLHSYGHGQTPLYYTKVKLDQEKIDKKRRESGENDDQNDDPETHMKRLKVDYEERQQVEALKVESTTNTDTENLDDPDIDHTATKTS